MIGTTDCAISHIEARIQASRGRRKKDIKNVELLNEPLIITLYRRRVEQLEARRAHNPKVAGSSPVPAIYSYPGKGAWDCEKRSREMSEWCKLTRSSWGLARSPGEDACQ